MSDATKLPRIAKRMRDQGQILCFCNGPEGARLYWLEPSQKKVSERAAQRAIASPFLTPSQDSLFACISQIYRFSEPA